MTFTKADIEDLCLVRNVLLLAASSQVEQKTTILLLDIEKRIKILREKIQPWLYFKEN